MKKFVCSILTILCTLFCFALGSCGGASIVLDAPDDLMMTDHWVLDWYEVLDATGYVVTLNTGETYETEETQLDMQFLTPGETYTISVQAKGGKKDGVRYLDSEPSEITLTMPAVSEGLTYTLIEGGTAYEVSGEDFLGAKMLVLPDTYKEKPITRIAGSGFYRKIMTGVRFPQRLQSIGANAFSRTDLEKVVFPSGLQEIGSYAFARTNLQEITIPQEVAKIGGSAFQDCKSLSQVTMPPVTPDLGGLIFEGTAWYENQPNGYVYLGNTLYRHKGDFPKNTHLDLGDFCGTNFADYVFFECLGVVSVDIPADIDKAEYLFKNCTDIKTVRLAEGLMEIPDGMFSGCAKITEISLPGTLVSIGASAFAGTLIEQVVFPATLVSIGASAFAGTLIEQVVCPTSLREIGGSAFYNCSNLKTVVLNDGLKLIDVEAFWGCDNLLGLAIPESVVSLSDMGYVKNIEWLLFSFFNGNFSYKETFGSLYSLEHIYIRATQEEILAVKENSEDFYLFCRTMTMSPSGKHCTKILYAYSENPPTEDGNYWHYDTDGVTPIPWEN